MGNCAIKPKVLKDSDEYLIPVEREASTHPDHNKDTAAKNNNIAPSAAEEVAAAVAAVRRSEKGKDILIEDDEEEHSKRQSLSLLFHEVIFQKQTSHNLTKNVVIETAQYDR